MKPYLSLMMFIFFLVTLNIYSQDIKAKLAGHQSANGFIVTDDVDNVLLKVTGDGNVGVNTNNPSGIFEIQGGVSTDGAGRSIKIIAESGEFGGNPGGNILLKSGTANPYGDPAVISLSGGQPGGKGGSINIFSGHGDEYGGDINIISSVGGLFPDNLSESPEFNSDSLFQRLNSNIKVGDINIGTDPSANMFGGKIKIYTGNDNAGGGDIEISTGGSQGLGNKIILQTGASDFGDGDIIFKAEVGGYNGGDIELTPNPNGGLVLVNGSGIYNGTWSQISDERFKKDIEPLKNALDKVGQLQGVSYNYKVDEFPDKNFKSEKQIGLIAQDVESVFPEFVSTDLEGYKSVAYQNLVAVLIEAVKEQQKNIEELNKKIESLSSDLNSKNVELSLTGN